MFTGIGRGAKRGQSSVNGLAEFAELCLAVPGKGELGVRVSGQLHGLLEGNARLVEARYVTVPKNSVEVGVERSIRAIDHVGYAGRSQLVELLRQGQTIAVALDQCEELSAEFKAQLLNPAAHGLNPDALWHFVESISQEK